MARSKVNPNEAARAAFKQEVRVKRAVYNVRQCDLADELNIGGPRMSALLANPDDLSAGRLREIIRVLRLEPEVVLAFLGYTQKDIRKLTERVRSAANG